MKKTNLKRWIIVFFSACVISTVRPTLRAASAEENSFATPESWGVYLEQSEIQHLLNLDSGQLASIARILSQTDAIRPEIIQELPIQEQINKIQDAVLNFAQEVFLRTSGIEVSGLATLPTEKQIRARKDLQNLLDILFIANNFPALENIPGFQSLSTEEIQSRRQALSDEIHERYSVLLNLKIPSTSILEDDETNPSSIKTENNKFIPPINLKPGQLKQSEDWKPIGPAVDARYLLVRGIMGNHTHDYMRGNLKKLKTMGLDSRFIDIATEGHREENLEKIRKAVEESPVPVVLIGHSLGGNLIHDAYRQWPDSLKSKVAKIVLEHPPLQGSPIADWILAHRFARLCTRIAGWLHYGNILGGLPELSTQGREGINASLPPLSDADLAKIYVVFSSFTPGPDRKKHRDMVFFHRIIERRTGEPNDGFVPVRSAILPGAHLIYLDDVGHEDTILQNPDLFQRLLGNRRNRDYPVSDLTRTLIYLLFH